MRRGIAYLPLAAVFSACGRCGARGTAPTAVAVLDLLPASAPAVALVPSLATLMRDASGLARAVARFPEGEMASGLLDALAAQLGFDPRNPKALAAAGIDGARSAAAVWEETAGLHGHSDGGEPWLALPLTDRGRFEETVSRLAASRLGADRKSRRGEVTIFSGAEGPAAALAFSGGYGLVAQGAEGADELARALARKRNEGLGGDPVFHQAAQKLGSDWDLEWHLPASSPYLPARLPHGGSFAAALSFRNGRLAARLVAMLSVAEGAEISGFAMTAGQSLVGLLPPENPVFARLGGNLALLGGAWDALVPPAIAEALAQAKIDAHKEVFENLEPGVVLSLGLAPHMDLSAMPSLDPRRADPFRFVTLAAFGKLRDPKAALATLGKLRSLPPGLGVTVERRRIADTDVATFHYQFGDGPSVAITGDTLAVTGGEGEMEAALARISGKSPGYQPPPWMRGPLLGRVSDGAVLDPQALRQSVEAIPASAYVGLTGLTLRSLVRRFSAPLLWLGPLTATVDVAPDSVVADAALVFRS
ncbi:MAG: hypothetical protein ACYDCL_03485 [Myxococcales bacterium]